MPGDEDVVFVFSRLRRVQVARVDAEWLERSWLRTQDAIRGGATHDLGDAIRAALDKAEDVTLTTPTRGALCDVLDQIVKQGQLNTSGLKELHAACEEPFAL